MAIDSELLAQLLASSGGGLSPSVSAATAGGLGRTDLAALLTPALGVGTGVIDPATLAAGLDAYYADLLREAQSKRASEIAGIEAQNIVVRPPEMDYDTVLPVWQSALDADPMIADAFAAIENRGVTPETAAAQLYDSYGGMDNWGELVDALGKFADEKKIRDAAARRYQSELANAEARGRAQVSALGEIQTPTLQQARMDYYKDAGLPALAFMPDPREQYQFTGEQALALQGRTNRPSGMTLAQELLAREIARGSQPRPTQPTPEQSFAQVPAGQQAPIRYTAAAQPRSTEQLARFAVEQEMANANIEARALQNAMALAGKTPFQKAMDELLKYGTMEANA